MLELLMKIISEVKASPHFTIFLANKSGKYQIYHRCKGAKQLNIWLIPLFFKLLCLACMKQFIF